MTILDKLVDYARERTEKAKEKMPIEEIRSQAVSATKGTFSFEKALKKPELSFICECKKASPSKGLISPGFPYLQIAREYEAAGTDCISVLTEPKWFLGSNKHLKTLFPILPILISILPVHKLHRILQIIRFPFSFSIPPELDLKYKKTFIL
jgi:indole-3-glycerol phosphate synthase